ncbi:MAG: glycosyltransferase family 10, partial [Candidatus Omnitrophica bacterium]|nr:glycosyltransferase family 10 [Candidatus Omnitrophota bacterium]
PAFPWHVGRKEKNNRNLNFTMGYDCLKAIKEYKKDKLISVVSSSKAFTKGHCLRLDFVRKLKEYFGERIDVFGRGIRDFEDKWDVVAPYKYHIVLENNSAPDYWTEKLSDAFLGCSYPLYYGCTNIKDYFPEGSFTCIDMNDADWAIKKIESCINGQVYERSIGKLLEAKSLILDKYNFFPYAAALVNGLGNQNDYLNEKITLFPQEEKMNFYQRCVGKARYLTDSLRGKF